MNDYFNDLNHFLANLQFDWQTVAGIIAVAIVLYIAFKIGAFVLKIVVGLAVIALVVLLVIKLLPFLGL
jgi:hypothetical protein